MGKVLCNLKAERQTAHTESSQGHQSCEHSHFCFPLCQPERYASNEISFACARSTVFLNVGSAGFCRSIVASDPSKTALLAKRVFCPLHRRQAVLC